MLRAWWAKATTPALLPEPQQACLPGCLSFPSQHGLWESLALHQEALCTVSWIRPTPQGVTMHDAGAPHHLLQGPHMHCGRRKAGPRLPLQLCFLVHLWFNSYGWHHSFLILTIEILSKNRLVQLKNKDSLLAMTFFLYCYSRSPF